MKKYYIGLIVSLTTLVIVNVLYMLNVGEYHQLAGMVCGTWFIVELYRFTKRYKNRKTA